MAKYIVTEIQTNNDGSVGTLLYSFDERNQAESQFHTIIAAAAISALPVHAATLVTNEGFMIDSACYKHEIQAVEVVEEGE